MIWQGRDGHQRLGMEDGGSARHCALQAEGDLPATNVEVILALMSRGSGALYGACAALLATAWISAGERARAAETASAEKGKWTVISDRLLADLEKEGKKPAWPGKTTGVAADRTTGDAFVLIPGQGVWRTADKGASFERVDGGRIGGRCETGWTINMDPAGKRMVCLCNYAWDPVGNVFYFANMSQPAWKYER